MITLLDLCSYTATAVLLYGWWSLCKAYGLLQAKGWGWAAKVFASNEPAERSVMEFGLVLTLILFLVGLVGLL